MVFGVAGALSLLLFLLKLNLEDDLLGLSGETVLSPLCLVGLGRDGRGARSLVEPRSSSSEIDKRSLLA